ncbi:MAG: T9SS type A sorting domain-containing protein [Gemmatimonadota bacterium]|nr:MAG: T9SS type A sorting domain-containing protein [Gemmatimonadota bacterium]
MITEDHLGKWFEIPARAGLQKEIDLGDKPFFISITTYITAGHGWAVEDEGTTPFHSFYYYYPGCRPGPSGNFGWHIQSPSVWFEAIVKYYELISRVHIDYYCVDDDSIGQSNGDGNGQSDPGETVELRVAIISSGVDIFGLMATLSTDDPAVVVSVDTVEYGDLSPDESTENTQTPFIISIESDVETHLAKFYLTFTTQDEYTKIDSFYVTIGKPLVLLVDDDGSDTYQDIYHYCLSENAVPFQTWEVERQGSPINKLNEHEIVIWFTGQSRENTLIQDDQASLISYLDNGGRLFLCGQDIGYDLFEKGNGVDFYTNYLRAQWMQDNSEDGFITSVPEDPISGDISGFLLIQENNENDYLRSPDVITPLLGATPVFEYSQTGKTAGLKYAAGYRLVYFAFPFENLTNLRPDFQIMKVDLLASIIDWLKGNPTNIEINESEVTSLREYSLSQNYPNPFNAQTKINYVIATDCMVTLEIYNLLGEKVTTLIDAHQSPGTYAVSWDATDLPSGVYFFRINANSFTATRGMVFMK